MEFMRVKVFQSLSYYADKNVSDDFEDSINDWLLSRDYVSVFKIESDIIGHVIVTRVWYEVK